MMYVRTVDKVFKKIQHLKRLALLVSEENSTEIMNIWKKKCKKQGFSIDAMLAGCGILQKKLTYSTLKITGANVSLLLSVYFSAAHDSIYRPPSHS